MVSSWVVMKALDISRALRPAARSQMMPSKGFGFEVGATSTDLNWSEYGKVYAYLPGFHPRHGLKVSAAVRHYTMDTYSRAP